MDRENGAQPPERGLPVRDEPVYTQMDPERLARFRAKVLAKDLESQERWERENGQSSAALEAILHQIVR